MVTFHLTCVTDMQVFGDEVQACEYYILYIYSYLQVIQHIDKVLTMNMAFSQYSD